MSELRKSTVRGVSWSLIEQFGIYAVRFVMGVILARLLSPKDFGLIGMITVFFTLALVFVNSGLGAGYIQKKNATDTDANTMFIANLVISIFMYIVLWFAAPYIAAFYEQPLLISLVRVMGLVVIINAFNAIQIAKVVRDINFKLRAKVAVGSSVISGLCGITAAYYGLGVWSLVIQQMGNRFFTTAGMYLTTKWKPGMEFSKQSFKELFSFGMWVMFTGLLGKLFQNINILVIGKLFPVSELGLFTKAKGFRNMFSNQISEAIGGVSFPVLSRFQDDPVKMRNGMKKFLQVSIFLIALIMILLIVTAKPFVILLLTEKWSGMIPYMQLLCITGIFYPINMMNVQFLMGQGKSNKNFVLGIIRNVTAILNLVIMYRWGVLYIIIGMVGVSMINIFINAYFTHKYINYGIFKQLGDIKVTLLATLMAGLAGYFVGTHVTDNYWLMLFLGGLTTATVYFTIHFVFDRKLFIEIVNLKESFK